MHPPLPPRMNRLVVPEPNRARVEECPVPEPGPGEVLVRVAACGVCGTDVHIFRGEYLGDYPVVPGHECAGTVVKRGAGVASPREGEPVAVEPNVSCGTCAACRRGRPNVCGKRRALGVTLPGGFAAYVAAPAANVFPAGGLPPEEAAFMEPLSCVLHGLGKLSVPAPPAAFVAGAGPVGILLMQVLADRGTRVWMGEPSPRRRAAAEELGAYRVLDTGKSFDPVREACPDLFDLVVDATGRPEVMEELPDLLRPGGEALLFGVPPRNARMAIHPFRLFERDAAVFFSYTSVKRSEEALALLREERVRVSPLVSHRFTLHEFTRAVACMEHPAEHGTLKVMILPAADSFPRGE